MAKKKKKKRDPLLCTEFNYSFAKFLIKFLRQVLPSEKNVTLRCFIQDQSSYTLCHCVTYGWNFHGSWLLPILLKTSKTPGLHFENFCFSVFCVLRWPLPSSVRTGSGRPAAGCSDAAGLQHVLHAAPAQHGHSQEEAQHQAIQGCTHCGHVFKPLLLNSREIIHKEATLVWRILHILEFLYRPYFHYQSRTLE